MAYEKYIKKGEKVYGPYLYHSKRIDGKVVSEYHGSKGLNYKKTILVVAGVLFLVAVIFVLFSSEREITGRAIFNLDANYQAGEPLGGKLRLSLQEGEFVPASSKLIFENNGNSYEYNLKELVSEEPNQGNFYVQGTGISGAGDGYGIQGQKKTYPKVHFVLSILSEQNQGNETAQEQQTAENTTQPETASESSSETNIVSQPETTTEIQATSQPETTTETQPEPTPEETAPITGGAISRLFSITGNALFSITGNAVVEFEREVSGEVSAGEVFSYTLKEGERAELKPRSVGTDSKQLSDSNVNLEVKGSEVIVTTEYYETESGFGKDYLGNSSKDILVDISKLGLILNPGDLKVSLVDSGQEILSLSTILEQGKVSANKTIEQPVPEIKENISAIEINQTTTETIFLPEVFELTEAERAVLTKAFGNASVEVKEAVEKRRFIIIRYELGNYWIENSYSSNLSSDTLKSFMERDKIKWLKDIAKSLSQTEEPGKELQEFLGNLSL